MKNQWKNINGFANTILAFSIIANCIHIIKNVVNLQMEFYEEWQLIYNIISNVILALSMTCIIQTASNRFRKIGVYAFCIWLFIYSLLGVGFANDMMLFRGIGSLILFSLLLCLKKDGYRSWAIIFKDIRDGDTLNASQENIEIKPCEIEEIPIEEPSIIIETTNENIIENQENIFTEDIIVKNKRKQRMPNNQSFKKIVKIALITSFVGLLIITIPILYIWIQILISKTYIEVVDNTMMIKIPKYTRVENSMLVSIAGYEFVNWPLSEQGKVHTFLSKIRYMDENVSYDFDVKEYIQHSKLTNLDKLNIAYTASLNNGKVPLKVTIGKDEYLFDLRLTPCYELSTTTIEGNCAKVYSKRTYTSYKELQVRSDLIELNKYASEEQIKDVFGFYNDLRNMQDESYETYDDVPIFLSDTEIGRYNVKSDLKADYYSLCLVSSEEELKAMIKYIISHDFSESQQSLKQSMSPLRYKGISGYNCLILAALNKDWSYTAIPIGVIAIDNTAPQNYACKCVPDDFLKIGNMSIDIFGKKPCVDGYAYVGRWQYDDYEWTTYIGNVKKVDLTLYHFGDIKSMTIRRTQDFCYRDKYSGRGIYPETKIIDLTNKPNPYVFSILLHLENGHNKIPYIVEDGIGNKRHGYISIDCD